MKIKINRACDLSSISVLPPRRSGGGGGMGSGASQLRSQQSQGSLSQQGASASHSQSQLSQASLDENLHVPINTDQRRFSSQDDSSKRISLPISSAREESQLQSLKVSSNPLHRWNTASLPDNRCQVANEELERKLQHLESSVHRMSMILESVQNDVMQINRAVKEVSLDTEGIRQKVLLIDNSVQQTLKGEDDIKAILDGSLKSIPDQLSKNLNSSKLNEISSALSALPGQMQANSVKLQNEIFRLFAKEMEVIVRGIRSLHSRHAAFQLPVNQSFARNEQSLRNQIPLTKVPSAPAPLVGYNRRVAAPKVEEGKLKVPQPKLNGASHSMTLKREHMAIRKEHSVSIIIDSDDDSDGGASCQIVKKETAQMESNWMNESREESLQILRKARKRRRREMNALVIS